jgi:GNAT superfamily N-acetyltransferase
MDKIEQRRSPVSGQDWYDYIVDDEKVGFLAGYWIDNVGCIYHLNGIKIEKEHRGKGLGEKLLIKFLKTYGGKILSNSNRTEFAQRMWNRMFQRNDVVIEVTPHIDRYLQKRFDHYLLSLKNN